MTEWICKKKGKLKFCAVLNIWYKKKYSGIRYRMKKHLESNSATETQEVSRRSFPFSFLLGTPSARRVCFILINRLLLL